MLAFYTQPSRYVKVGAPNQKPSDCSMARSLAAWSSRESATNGSFQSVLSVMPILPPYIN